MSKCRRCQRASTMVLLLSLLLVGGLQATFAQLIYYDTYNGSVLTQAQVTARQADGTSFYCVNAFRACNATEGRRIDGSCNSLATPYAGAGHGQFLRFLPANFSSGTEPRLAANGSALPPPRWLRTRAMATGRIEGSQFTQLMLLFFVFAATDIAAMSIHDTLNYVISHPNCCTAAGASDPVCYPMQVPWDDPVHRFSGIRCLNMTRPISFQSSGCVDANTTPVSRMNFGTPSFDLSNMYGNLEETSNNQRLFTGGLLNFTTISNGAEWPQYIAPTVNRRDGIQGLTGVNFIFGLYYWREHNRIARQLARINPCWNDERLFMTARDINIGQYSQVVFEELFGLMMGKQNLRDDGILGDNAGHRDPYVSTTVPGEYIESLMALRWVHTIQEGMLQLYTANGSRIGEFPEVNFTLSTAALAQGQNMVYYGHGATYSRCGKIDNIIDPIVTEQGLGPLQRVVDLTTSDIMKNRLFGIQPYINYLNYCNGPTDTYDTFESLFQYIDADKRYLLSQLYNATSDIDLIVGLWLEDLVDNGNVPKTLYCLVSRQLLRTVQSDRHWYERPNRPNAFTAQQLASIRNASAARLMCDSGDQFTVIQPRAFEQISSTNAQVACSTIPGIDLNLWRDATCTASG